MIDEILTIRKRNAKERKGAKYAKEYYAEHGSFPSLSEINAHKALTPEELAAIAYSREVFALVKEGEEMDDVVAPEVIENTPEQEVVAETIVSTLLEGTKDVTIEEGTINNFTVPAEVNVAPTITGEVADGATIKSETTKSITIVNTSEEPVSVSVEAAGTVYLRGKYNDVYLNGKSFSVSSSIYPEVYGEITIAPEVDENVSVTAAFQEGSSIKYLNDKKLTVSNSNPEAEVEIYAPYATVEIGGKYEELTASVSEHTLVLKSGFHTNVLNVNKGSVMYYGDKLSDFVTEPLAPGVVAVPYTLDITAANYSKMTSNGGVYNLVEDIELTNKSLSFTVLSNGGYTYNLNGHTFICGRNSTACIYLRGTTPTVTITGNGSLINNSDSYGVWVATTGSTLNVESGNFSAYTHVLYAYEGTINVYGGAFRLLGEYEKDEKGRAKFLLNCYDANYTAGKAHINVYGGKFYNFNPAESYGEPGAPVSFVAEGYGVIESEENGEKVYTVVPID